MQRSFNRSLQPPGPNVKHSQCRWIANQGWIAQTVNQLASDAGIHRRDQSQPQTGKSRCQHGHGNGPAPQAALPGVFGHDFAVTHLIGAANLEHSALFDWQRQRLHQVGDQIFNRDRLGFHRHPARADHHRQTLHQGPNHFERQAAGADDDRRAKLDRRNFRSAQNVSHFLTTAQMGRQ